MVQKMKFGEHSSLKRAEADYLELWCLENEINELETKLDVAKHRLKILQERTKDYPKR
jgi:hypothetical protein